MGKYSALVFAGMVCWAAHAAAGGLDAAPLLGGGTPGTSRGSASPSDGFKAPDPPSGCTSPLAIGSNDAVMAKAYNALTQFWRPRIPDWGKKPLAPLHAKTNDGSWVTVVAWADLQRTPDYWSFLSNHTVADAADNPGGLVKIAREEGFGPPDQAAEEARHLPHWTLFKSFHQVMYSHFVDPTKPFQWIQWTDPYVQHYVDIAGGDRFAAVTILAHEFGHHVQNVGGRDDPNLFGGRKENPLRGASSDDPYVPNDEPDPVARERDADRVAGIFIGSLNSKACLNTAAWTVFHAGDTGPISKGAVPHGDGADRADCIRYGALVPPGPTNPFLASDSSAVVDCKKIRTMCAGKPKKTGQASDGIARVAFPSDAASGDELENPYCEDTPPEPVIGPPVVTGNESRCVKTVFEISEGCRCPSNMYADQLGKGEHAMIWCRSRGRVRM